MVMVMVMVISDKIEHDCGSTSLQVFERDDGDVDGYCFSCSTYVRNPYGDTAVEDRPKRKVKSQEDIQAEISEISTYQTKTLSTPSLTTITNHHHHHHHHHHH